MTLLATQITDALIIQLEYCRESDGYTTDVGSMVLPGIMRGGAPQAPCVFVTPGRVTETRDEYGAHNFTRTYELNGFCDANQYPSLAECELVDRIAWDLRRCLWTAGTGLTSLIRDLRTTGEQPGYREDGGSLVGCALTVEIDYAIDTSDPDTPL